MLTHVRHEEERRVLLVAPTRRDGEVTHSLLTKAGLSCVLVEGLRELAHEIKRGAGVVLLTEEALAASEIDELLVAFANQPPWSDLAIVMLMHGGLQSSVRIEALRSLSNVTLLERPTSTRSVLSAVQTALRGRERQYQIREQLETIRRAEVQSRMLQQQLEIAVDASELGTFYCKLPARRLVWNERCKAQFWLPADAEIDFERFYSLLHADDRERTRLSVEACIGGGQGYEVEYRTVSPQGEVRWIRSTGRTAYNERREPVRFDGTTQDITRRKLAEDALKEASRRKDEFLATLAHELRTPLAPIRNSLHLLRLSDDLSPSLGQVREIMEHQIDHMVRLVDDLLDISRITSGKIELRLEVVELAAIFAGAVETLQPLIDEAGHQLSISLPAEPILVHADPIRLSQVVDNLLNNAVKYMDPGGQISLTARRDGAEALVSVRDTGLGIPAEMLPHVFDMFAQVERSLNRAQGGLGIGLALARSLIQLHGGRIEAHSRGPGQGSEFIVYLPLIQNSTHRAVPKKTSTHIRGPLPRRRILIVDDTRAAEYVLGKLLETMGQQVRSVNSAAAALESVQGDRPHVVISDIAMPIMDGYELAHRLRQEPGLDDLVLVALTGFGQEDDKLRAKQSGFDYHLVKPVSLDALQELLASLPSPSPQV